MPNKTRIILSPILLPLSLLYGFIVYIRNRFYDYKLFKSNNFNIPLISVGNITVGGTGKTPHIEYLVDFLKSDFKVATLSRGYKRNSKGFVLSTSESTVMEIGDEPRQIKQKFPEIDVAVDADRSNGINQLIASNSDLDVILLDDAYQHRKINTNLSILLIDYSRPIDKDYILPFGDLREHAFEKKRANIIIITKSPKDLKPIDRRLIFNELKSYPFQVVYFTSFEYGKLKTVYNTSANKVENENLNDYDILLITGIANPKPLQNHILENISKNIHKIEYPDHYNFKESDIKKIINKFDSIESNKKIIITTEKDAMRLQKFSNIADNLIDSFFYIPIKVEFLNDRTDNFNQQITEYVRKNKKHSFLYPR
ncbi:MAG: tetraacyldisaccharide 4'-kinase [Bacteroidales bacterium]|jgi:tetraacyldisaccharide 4'-kinase|nr:tetraacyldisaccharide 4'-kinase [Bacteroidales bacterium]